MTWLRSAAFNLWFYGLTTVLAIASLGLRLFAPRHAMGYARAWVRLVLAGLHAGSATEARQRLVDLGADEALLSSTLRGVLFQELVARPCGCEVAADCAKCRGAGRRRELVAELSAPARTGLRGVA